jgi:DNA-directed RNA polymerase specialized sigma24 family protein
MDDNAIVSAMRAGSLATLAGIAGAYDRYAAPLYGYCCWLLGDADIAAEVVRDTFLLAMTDLRNIRDPELLSAQLYAVARVECHQRQQAGTGSDRQSPASSPQAGLRGLIVETLAKLDDQQREVVELTFRHGLSHADLALVFGIPQRRASALVTRIQSDLVDTLAVPVVAFTGEQACAKLNDLLSGWDGHLTLWRKTAVEGHIEECLTCESLRYQAFHPAIVYALDSPADLPADLRGQVIALCVDSASAEHAARGENSAPTARHAKLGTVLALAVVVIWVAVAVGVLMLTILG